MRLLRHAVHLLRRVQPVQRLTTCVIGRWALMQVIGCRWRYHRTDHTAWEEGVIFGYPVTCSGGQYEIVQGLEINAFSQERIDATNKELREERAAVEKLFGGQSAAA